MAVLLMTGLLPCRRCVSSCTPRITTTRSVMSAEASGALAAWKSGVLQLFRQTCRGSRPAELIFEAIGPASVDAANAAEEQLADRRQQRRRLIVDRLEASRESEARVMRVQGPPAATYTTVRARLAQEWDDALRVVQTQQDQLAEFDRRQAALPTPEQRRELNRLGGDVRRIWNHPPSQHDFEEINRARFQSKKSSSTGTRHATK